MILNKLFLTLLDMNLQRVRPEKSSAYETSQLDWISHVFELRSIWEFKLPNWREPLVSYVSLALLTPFSMSPQTHIVETSFAPITFEQRPVCVDLRSLIVVHLEVNTSFQKLGK